MKKILIAILALTTFLLSKNLSVCSSEVETRITQDRVSYYGFDCASNTLVYILFDRPADAYTGSSIPIASTNLLQKCHCENGEIVLDN